MKTAMKHQTMCRFLCRCSSRAQLCSLPSTGWYTTGTHEGELGGGGTTMMTSSQATLSMSGTAKAGSMDAGFLDQSFQHIPLPNSWLCCLTPQQNLHMDSTQ